MLCFSRFSWAMDKRRVITAHVLLVSKWYTYPTVLMFYYASANLVYSYGERCCLLVHVDSFAIPFSNDHPTVFEAEQVGCLTMAPLLKLFPYSFFQKQVFRRNITEIISRQRASKKVVTFLSLSGDICNFSLEYVFTCFITVRHKPCSSIASVNDLSWAEMVSWTFSDMLPVHGAC